MAKSRSRHREDRCPVDADPAACWVRQGCRYWDRVLRLCTYRVVKDAELKQRQAEGFHGSSIMERIRIDSGGG